MIDAITTVNNIPFRKRDIIMEIKSNRSATYHQTEMIKNEKNRVVGQRFHFAAPLETAKRIEDFFETEVVQKSDYQYYLEFETRPKFKR